MPSLPFLTRENLIKLVALLVIVGFVVELFIVYSYSSPQNSHNQQGGATAAASSQQLQYVSAALAPFAIRGFTGSVYFVCNTTNSQGVEAAVRTVPNLAGRPIDLGGQTSGGKLFLARAATPVDANAVLVGQLQEALIDACDGEAIVLREATVYYNSSTAMQLVNLADRSKTATVSKRLFDSYTDQYGRSSTALITDQLAVEGSIVQLYAALTLQGEGAEAQIVPSSLRLEQPPVSNVQTFTQEVRATVLSLSDRGVAIVSMPWQQRYNLSGVLQSLNSSGALISTQLERQNKVVVYNAPQGTEAKLAGAPFVEKIERDANGSLIITVPDPYTNTTQINAVLDGLNYSLPLSRVAGTVNYSSFVQPALSSEYSLTFYRLAQVAAIEPVENAQLPPNFTALVFPSTTVGQNVTMLAEVAIRGGQAQVSRPKQIS